MMQLICMLFSIYFSISSPILFSEELKSNDEVKKEEPVEIQVIRPRFFSKINRLELGAESLIITNQSFVYTYLVEGILTYHLNDYIGFEANYAYGISSNKEEKDILVNDFDIRTEIDRVKSMTLLGATFTPI